MFSARARATSASRLGPLAIFIIQNPSCRVAAGVGGVVPCAVVGGVPVEELVMAVGSADIGVEKIGHGELAKANFQAPRRKPRGQREGTTWNLDLLLRKWNDLLEHQPRDVGRGTNLRIAHHVEVGKSGQPQGA